MSTVNLNNSEDYVKELKIFNDGKAGVVEGVRVRIEKKNSTDPSDKSPNYKVIASDGKGEVNEGFYYQEPDSDAFNKYQAQRLINLAKGVLGDDVKFPVFNTPTEALDGVMRMVAPELTKFFRVAVCYGTTKKRAAYLGFKNFGSFIQTMNAPNKLKLEAMDSLIKGEPKTATSADTLIPKTTPAGNPDNLEWLNS